MPARYQALHIVTHDLRQTIIANGNFNEDDLFSYTLPSGQAEYAKDLL